jgi:hypothetical protein
MSLRSLFLAGDPRLESAYAGGASVKPLPHPEPVETVQRIQLALDYLTYPFLRSFDKHGEPDGLFGPDTTWCVRAFQQAVFPYQREQWDAHLGPHTLAQLDTMVLRYGCPPDDTGFGDGVILASVKANVGGPSKPKPKPRPKRGTVSKRIEVSLDKQILQAFAGAQLVFNFECVTGDSDNPTPAGNFAVFNKDRNHVSHQFHVPMHFAMFFKDGKAIHQYHGITPLGIIRTFKRGIGFFGSHGCVRLTEDDASHSFAWTPMQTPVKVF